jgi:diguanylate cyclase (GGDEF)-like protein
MVCRYGGDEFILVLPEASPETAQERAESLRAEAKQIQLEYESGSVKPLTVSVGVAVFPKHCSTAGEIFLAADTALYRAKNEGRYRVIMADAARPDR